MKKKQNLKETLLSTLVHGPEILEDIAVMRKLKRDLIDTTPVDAPSRRLHAEDFPVLVNERIDLSNGAIYRFVAKEGILPPFVAGQYVSIHLVGEGLTASRPYSLTSSPKERGYYEIFVARSEGGFYGERMLHSLHVGDALSLSGPYGRLGYNPIFHKRKSLFLAGGSAVTPFISMLRENYYGGERRDIVLLYGIRSPENACFLGELQDLESEFPSFRFHLVVEEAPSDYQGERGVLDEEKIKRLVPDYAERTAYLSGSEAMHEAVKKSLLDLGFKQKDIREELFGASKDVTKEAAYPKERTEGKIFRVKVGDRVLEADPKEPILVALERAKLPARSACRSGECGLCRIKLLKGEVYMAKGTLLRAADSKFGYVHACKAYPLTDLEIDY